MARSLLLLLGLITLNAHAQPGLDLHPRGPEKQPFVWTEGPTTGRLEDLQARAAWTVLWSEDFEAGLGSWVVQTLSGPVSWALTSTGNTGGFTPGPLESTTGFPGGSWVVADSDLEGTPGVMENTTLSSPPILGLDTHAHMLLRFEQSFRQLNGDQTVVEVSGNGGLNWTAFPVNQDIPGNASTPGAPEAQVIILNISSALTMGSSDVRIRLRWLSSQGFTYSWQVDDIALLAALPNDLHLLDVTHSAWDLTESDFRRLPYTVYRAGQTRPLNFRGRVVNNGSTAQTNVRLQVEVDGPGANDVTLVSPSITLAPGQKDSLYITSYTPPDVIGTYLLTYTMLQDAVDDAPDDNVLSDLFDLDPHLFARDRASMSQDLDNEGGAFMLGNWYHTTQAATVYAIDVAISERSDPGAIITVELLDENRDPLMSSDEYEIQTSDLCGFGEGIFITVPLIDPVILDANKDYFVAVRHFGGTDDVFVGMSGQSYQQTSLIFDGPVNTWFFVRTTPMVRMNFDATARVNETDAYPFRLVAQPSLFDAGTVVHYTLERSSPLRWDLRDAGGRLVASGDKGLQAAGRGSVSIDGGSLAPGTYLFTLQVGEQRTSTRLVRMP
ncbi:MAG: hypothetical protein JNM31_11625 [Flavobacteriales bacterium]|nr:hypothetical protein [Flavobacteriales bacterium]